MEILKALVTVPLKDFDLVQPMVMPLKNRIHKMVRIEKVSEKYQLNQEEKTHVHLPKLSMQFSLAYASVLSSSV